MLVLAVPAIVIALSAAYVTTHFLDGRWYQTTPLLILVYAVMFFPMAVVSVRAAVARAPIGLEEVGQSLGVTKRSVFWRVTLPLIGPGLAAAFCLVFLETATELIATLILIPTGMQTLATGFWAQQTNLSYGAAAPYAGMMLLIAAVPSYVLGRWFDRLPSRAAAAGTPVVAPVAGDRPRPPSGHNWAMKELAVRGARKSFGDLRVLDGVDLTVPAGSFTGILGASGSGKTTLLRIIAGFERLDHGEVVLGVRGGRRRPPCLRAERAPAHRLRAPGGGALPAPLGRPQRGLRPAPGAAPARPGARAARHGGAVRPAPPLPPPALGWPATARRAGARAGHRARDRAARRALLLARREPARQRARRGARRLAPGRAPRPSSSPTTRTRRCRWPTRWPCSATASSRSSTRPPASTATPSTPPWPASSVSPTSCTPRWWRPAPGCRGHGGGHAPRRTGGGGLAGPRRRGGPAHVLIRPEQLVIGEAGDRARGGHGGELPVLRPRRRGPGPPRGATSCPSWWSG